MLEFKLIHVSKRDSTSNGGLLQSVSEIWHYFWFAVFCRGYKTRFHRISLFITHYNDVIMSAMASLITNFLLNRFFWRRSKKTSKLRVTGLCAGNSPVTGEFPAQRASNAENVSIWWRHHSLCFRLPTIKPMALDYTLYFANKSYSHDTHLNSRCDGTFCDSLQFVTAARFVTT